MGDVRESRAHEVARIRLPLPLTPGLPLSPSLPPTLTRSLPLPPTRSLPLTRSLPIHKVDRISLERDAAQRAREEQLRQVEQLTPTLT